MNIDAYELFMHIIIQIETCKVNLTMNTNLKLICLQVNDSSPRSLLSQLCDLLASRPVQGLVYEDERPLPLASGPLSPMLEFVSAQTGLPIVAVGGGAGLGRVPQV